jgi:FkbM family methyltransferase
MISDYPNYRENLKLKLDNLVSGNFTTADLQRELSGGPKRDVVISPDHVELRLANPARNYRWNITDPRTSVACLVVEGIYEPLETEILRTIAASSQIIVDVGANIGYYSIELGKEMKTGGKVVAVEPVLSSFHELEFNVGLNGLLETVVLCNLGLSNLKGPSEIFVPEVSGSSAASTRNLHNDEGHRVENIQLTTLDELLGELGIKGCDLIKIDVEGAELLVLQGGTKIIEEYKPVIFAEVLRKWSAHFSYTPNTLLDFLGAKGYKCWGVSKKFREIVSFTDADEETNFVFVHASDKLNVIPFLETMRAGHN